MAYTIKVIDTQPDGEFMPEKWVGEGYSGVIFKAGQGGWPYVIKECPDWPARAKAAGLEYGWYWLSDSRYHSMYHIDGMRATGFFDLPLKEAKLGVWIDVEKPVLAMTEADYRKTPYAGWKNTVDFVYNLTLQPEMQGIILGIYTGPGAFSLCCEGIPKSQADYLAQFPLWTAQYNDFIDVPDMYGSWTQESWLFWQRREGPDVNWFYGSVPDFERIFGYHPIISTGELPMPNKLFHGSVMANPTLNVRSTPDSSVSTNKVGTLNYGDKIVADGDESTTNGWWRLISRTDANGNPLPLPAGPCYAFAGSSNGYIRLDRIEDVTPPPPPPPPASEFVVKMALDTITIDGVVYAPKSLDGHIVTYAKEV